MVRPDDAIADRKVRQREELTEIRNGLRTNAAALAERLLGTKPTRAGRDLRFGDTGRIKVTLEGPGAGLWHDHGANQGGDLLTLIERELCLPFHEAVAYARSYLGMPEPDYSRPLSQDERSRRAERVAAARAEQARADAADAARIEARREQVARRAEFLWASYAASPATKSHPYVTRKGIDPAGLRVNRRGLLLIPMHDEAGKLWSLQRIWPGGEKRGLKGGRMKGCFHLIGQTYRDVPIAFCEGEATGRSIHACTGLPVVVTFSAGNMREVMRAWRARHPEQPMIAAGDNDHAKPRQDPPKPNVGAETTEQMRVELGAIPALPPFAEGDPGTDWNDYQKQYGAASVWDAFDLVVARIFKPAFA